MFTTNTWQNYFPSVLHYTSFIITYFAVIPYKLNPMPRIYPGWAKITRFNTHYRPPKPKLTCALYAIIVVWWISASMLLIGEQEVSFARTERKYVIVLLHYRNTLVATKSYRICAWQLEIHLCPSSHIFNLEKELFFIFRAGESMKGIFHYVGNPWCKWRHCASV
jgi:hypothetical protein